MTEAEFLRIQIDTMTRLSKARERRFAELAANHKLLTKLWMEAMMRDNTVPCDDYTHH